jgi:cell division protein FtsW
MVSRQIDRFFLGTVIILVFVGFFIFSSASLGLLGREGASFSTVALKQSVLLLLGLALMALMANIPYKGIKKFAPFLFGLSLILTLLVFLPSLGLEAGGAKRWLQIAGFSLQPAELLKLGFVIYLAAWLAAIKDKVRTTRYGLLPFLVLLALPAAVLLAQPDTGTFMIIFAAAVSMFIVAGGRFRHLLVLAILASILVGAMAYHKPYIRHRLITFVNPSADVRGASYQLNQSLIAVGSGGITGRGFGQSVQKFNFLPEPIGDSIFAVASEEFGFVGSIMIVILFLLFGLWGLKIAARLTDPFGRLLVSGIVILITAQSFINIAAMLGLIPLTGVPLVFISHGGTALLLALVQVGIILNASKYKS